MTNSAPLKPKHDITSDDRFEFRYPGAAVTELRTLLENPQIAHLKIGAQREPDFESCLARIGADLGVILDGSYEVDEIVLILIKHIRLLIASPFSGLPVASNSIN